MSGLAVGIDLGTTNSLLAFAKEGEDVSVLVLGESRTLLPSCVFVARGGSVVLGEAARKLAPNDPERFYEHWKREMGDPHWERTVEGIKLTPLVLSSMVLRKLVEEGTRALGPIEEAVITVPAWFGDLERGATLDAARIAGIPKVRALNEPTAAALAYGLAGKGRSTRRALVYDLGGGTFDVTVVELSSEGDEARVKVLATAGERKLGGKDWDDELVNMVSERVFERTSLDPRDDPRVLALLRRDCERAKISLSDTTRAIVRCTLGGENYEVLVTRSQLEQRTKGLVEQTASQLVVVLEKAKLRWADIDAVLPVGGATRMPMIRAALARISGKEPLQLLHPEEAVARGACAYAALLARGEALALQSENTLTVDAERQAEEAITEPPPAEPEAGSDRERAPLLSSDTVTADPASSDGLSSSDRAIISDEVIVDDDDPGVPLLPGKQRVPEVHDVVSHGLGVSVVTPRGRKNVILIPEQTPVPVKRTRPFVTIRDGQTAVRIKVLEGDGEDAEGCTVLGVLIVDGLPPGRPKGMFIEVTYEYDEDGRVQVSARDVKTGKAARATIARVGALEPSEIDSLRVEVAKRVAP